MDPERCAPLFDELSSLLIAYQPGDLLKIADMAEALARLAPLSPLPYLSDRPLALLAELCAKEMRGQGGPGFAQAMSEGIDLLHAACREIPAALDRNLPPPPHVVEALNAFVAAHDAETPAAAPRVESADARPVEAPAPAAAAGGDIQAQVMATFLQEARERLELAQARVLDLEGAADPAPILNELFRVFHTFKGETGFLRLPRLGELAHHYESVLDQLRDGRLALREDLVDLLLAGIDAAAGIVKTLSRTPGDEGDSSAARALVSRLAALCGGVPAAERERSAAAGPATTAAVPVPAAARPSPAAAAPAADARPEGADQMVKIRAGQIQYLVDMLGELMISLNQLDDEDRRVQASRKIAKNLQLAAMQASTVGIGGLFSTMRRVVRESCRQVGKEADLAIAGDDLEVDRNLVDSLGEPLMHLLRNAVGHGVETAAERAAAGKPARGRIELSAARVGHSVVIRVRDDGRGLDCERIRAKAVERGLVGPDRAAALGRQEVFNLIFAPGFSTAERVDAISGRGVGMDVVKTMVERLRGRVGLDSEEGRYTEVSLTFAINMAIVDGMIVQVGPRWLIIPIAAVVESLNFESVPVREVSGGTRVCSLRGETMPVVDLGAWFGLARPPGLERSMAVVVEAAGGKYALLVHDIVAKREVVIKSLGRLFAKSRGISAGAILQGGRIGLVVDVDQIVRPE